MSAYIPVELQRRIRTHFRNCCAYYRTAEALTVAIFEFEHIVPRSVGGDTVFENLCLSCPTCNRYKATLQAALDPTTEQTVPLATIAALKMNRPQLTRVRRIWVKVGEHPPTFE